MSTLMQGIYLQDLCEIALRGGGYVRMQKREPKGEILVRDYLGASLVVITPEGGETFSTIEELIGDQRKYLIAAHFEPAVISMSKPKTETRDSVMGTEYLVLSPKGNRWLAYNEQDEFICIFPKESGEELFMERGVIIKVPEKV